MDDPVVSRCRMGSHAMHGSFMARLSFSLNTAYPNLGTTLLLLIGSNGEVELGSKRPQMSKPLKLLQCLESGGGRSFDTRAL